MTCITYNLLTFNYDHLIRGYQKALDAVREDGAAQVARYVHERPDMRARIERQHQNFQV